MTIKGEDDINPYQQEHNDLFKAIRLGQYKINDTKQGADATLSAIIGRMATYSGQVITWDEAIKMDQNLVPISIRLTIKLPFSQMKMVCIQYLYLVLQILGVKNEKKNIYQKKCNCNSSPIHHNRSKRVIREIKSLSEKPFQLNYAPHFGMFESMAGKDLMDQIQFMHDQGFRSLEDNGMKNRSKKTQNDIAKKMEKLGMSMGVFVGHKIYWKEPNLTSGDKSLQDEFVENIEIRRSCQKG